MARKSAYQFTKGGGKKTPKAPSANPPKTPKNAFSDAKQQFRKGAPRAGRKR